MTSIYRPVPTKELNKYWVKFIFERPAGKETKARAKGITLAINNPTVPRLSIKEFARL